MTESGSRVSLPPHPVGVAPDLGLTCEDVFARRDSNPNLLSVVMGTSSRLSIAVCRLSRYSAVMAAVLAAVAAERERPAIDTLMSWGIRPARRARRS